MVDAGFLLKALVLQVGADSRESAAFDYAAISEVLADLVEEQTGARLTRQIWYDAARDSRPRVEHRALAALPGVQVRLGWIVVVKNSGPRQKAVDTLIVRDLLRIAYRASAEEVVLLAGDGDLVPGVQEASEYGVIVHLWGISSEDGRLNQSGELIALADTRLNLDVADLAPFVRVKGRHAPPKEAASGLVEDSDLPPLTVGVDDGGTSYISGTAAGVAAPGAGGVLGDVAIEDPADMAIRAASEAEEVVKSAVSLPPSASTGAPSLCQLLTPEEFNTFWLDDQMDGVDATESGRRYGQRWVERVDAEVRERFLQRYKRSRVPKRIDMDLIGALKARQIDVEEQADREAARNGFWDALEKQPPEKFVD